MPLNVKVELERAGVTKVIAVLRVENIGGTEERGDYRVYEIGNPDAPYGSGRVLGHARLTESVWALVAKALRSLGFKAEG